MQGILFYFFCCHFASFGSWGSVWVGEGTLLSPARLNRVKTLLSKTECEASREPAGSEPIPVWPSGPRLLWKKHHARKERTLCKQPSGGAATPSMTLTPQPLFSPPQPRLGKSKSAWQCGCKYTCEAAGGVSMKGLLCGRRCERPLDATTNNSAASIHTE